MKALPFLRQDKDGKTVYSPCTPKEATHVRLCLPGPTGTVFLPVLIGGKTRHGTNCWSWNGDTEKPTLKPSLLVRGNHKLSEAQYEHIMAGGKVKPRPFRYHTYITDGKVKFLHDTDHELKDQTVELLDVEY